MNEIVRRLPGAIFRFESTANGGMRWLHLSPPAAPLLGLEWRELYDEPGSFLRHVHVEDLILWAEARRRAFASGESSHYVFRYSRRGELRWIAADCSPGVAPPGPAFDGHVYWDGILSDVTGFKETELALTRSRALLGAAQELAHLGCWDFDTASGKITWSPETYAIHGLDPAQGEPDFGRLSQLYHPDDFPVLLASVQRAMATGEGYRHDLRIIRPPTEARPAPEVRYVSATGATLRDPMTGVVVRLFGTLLDITDRKNLEETLKAARDAAQAAAQVKADFLATMSHEIRTPLHGIAGMTALLAATSLDLQQRDYCATIRSSGEMLLAVVNDILDFSQIEAAKMSLESVPFEVAPLLNTVVDIVRPQADARGLYLRLTTPETPMPPLVGDPTRLRQVLLNLAANAVKFTEQGGVEIAMTASLGADGCSLRIGVTDTGIGIPSEVLKNLFHRFSQADSSTQRRFGGTGLGLAICRKLMDLMNGSLGVESRQGEGSTFWLEVTLPVAHSSGPMLTPPTEASMPGAPLRVLLAEDNLTNLRLATLILERAGHRVVAATDGFEALAAAASAHYDIILMDGHMPGMDGYTAARRIRGEGIQIPMVALTASALPEDRARCLEAGMDDHLAKPFLPHQLLAVVERWGRTSRRVESLV